MSAEEGAESRIERDALGEKAVPKDAYFGIQTVRAVENFPISGQRADPELIHAYGCIKWAAALTNSELGELDQRRSELIVRAAREVAEGRLDAEFVVDVFQAGAGTSFHMNVNEVVCNRAIELAGGRRGDYRDLHPNDHVNRAQSTNDTFPTATRIALVRKGARLEQALGGLAETLEAKADELDDVLTSGRTHLQDAVPIRYGQVLRGYAGALVRVGAELAAAREALRELPIGGTAVGTGLNSHPDYAGRVVEHLRNVTGEDLRPGRDLVELMSSQADLARYSSCLRGIAMEVGRIANDLRLLASGPRTGLGDLRLPAVQPGSSIMPGKVNPSIPEMVNMACFQVLGYDHTVALAVQAGQLQLNVMVPVVAYALLSSQEILTNALAVFDRRCVAGLDADRGRCSMHLQRSAALATLLSPALGYSRAAELTKEAVRTERDVLELVKEKGILTEAQMDELLEPRRVTGPGRSHGESK